jgi:hypothetical protein
MPIFRKKPIEIEARQLPDLERGPDEAKEFLSVAKWCEGETTDCAADGTCILINTLEGQMKALPGDFIIKGVKGEFYPCKPNIFAATYEPVTE